MKFFTARRVLLIAGALLLAMECDSASAQNRNAFGSSGQGGFGAGTQGVFRDSGQFGQGGQRQQGRSNFGQSNNRGRGQQGRGRQGGNFGNRPDNFVGSDAQQIRRQRNAQNGGRRQRARIDYTVENLNDMRGSSRQRSTGSSNSPVRLQLRPLFTVSQPSASELTTRASTQLSRALPTTVAGAKISISNGTATIAGSVKNEYNKLLAARILSLQPGISQIDNRLTIESDLAAPLLFPAR